jgi:hypothetical protein
MKSYDKLEIAFKPSIETFNKITDLLKVKPSNILGDIPASWVYEIIDEDENTYYDFINEFLDILENKYETLAKLGIERSDITIWYLYEYDQQCNMEFDPKRLKRLGDNGIKLCISCWDSGKEYNVTDASQSSPNG